MNLKSLIVAIFFLFSFYSSYGYQSFVDKEAFFLKHLKNSFYSLDTAANAVVLYEKGNYKIEMRANGSFRVSYTIRRIVKILTKAGIKEGDVSFPYHSSDGYYGDANGVSAKTYNLVNGKVVISKLDNNVISDEQVNDYSKMLNFSHSSVGIGSIIDYSYTVEEDLSMSFGTWIFQDEIPTLYSEIDVDYPNLLSVAVITKTSVPFVPFSDNKHIISLSDTTMPEAYTITPKDLGGHTTIKWVRRNVPAIIEEPHVYNTNNYKQRIELYLAGSDRLRVSDFTTWDKLNKHVNGYFLSFLNHSGGSQGVKEILSATTHKEKDSLGIAKLLYYYVRDSFNVSMQYGIFPDGKMSKLIADRRGTSVDINLLLIKLLRESGFQADPVIQSTKEMMRLDKSYPLIERINYVLCRVYIAGVEYFLDATAKYNSFGLLRSSSYNGFAWAVNSDGYEVGISSDNFKERNSVVITAENDTTGGYVLSVLEMFGDIKAAQLREEWIGDSTKLKEYILRQLKTITLESELLSFKIENLNKADETLKLNYKLKMKWPDVDIITFSPSFSNYINENPFKATIRIMPVEMPCAIDANYMLILKLPTGFKMSESPESKMYKLDDNNYYKYLVEFNEQSNTLSMSTKLVMKNTFFDTKYYQILQSFYTNIIEQQKQPCVISKITE